MAALLPIRRIQSPPHVSIIACLRRSGLLHPHDSLHYYLLLLSRSRSPNPRHSSTMARTYDSALAHLAALQSNRAITSLFTPPSLPASSSSSTGTQDLNALAIPEMLAWLQRGGVAQDDIAAKLRCVHVAGTKGKGSVCAYLTALLARGDEETRAAAGKVGTYTSPHLVSVRERIAIDGAPISRALFARYFFEVWDACTEAARAELVARRAEKQDGEGEEISEEELQGPSTKPFYFRFLTIVALRAFLGEGVRSAVIECGIGGEYDSTNVLPATSITASVVTQLGIDHVGMLGRTLPEIAWHKAGVCKAGRKCFTRRLGGKGDAETTERTMHVLRQRASERGATLVEVEDADVERWGGVSAGGKEPGSLEGEFQKYNQALAVLAAREHLRVLASVDSNASRIQDTITATTTVTNETLDDIPPSFTSALQHARLRGRCETREDEHAPITWLIDGAHTAESLTEVARWFVGKINRDASSKTKTILVFNQQDRDAAKLISGLLGDINAAVQGSGEEAGGHIFTHAIFTRNDLEPRVVSTNTNETTEPERDLSVQRAAAAALNAISPSTPTSVLDNVADTVEEVRALASRQSDDGRRTMVLVTGSLHLVGAFLRTLEPDAED
ncbi:FolC bifunctional protein [Nemania serpens]|nr:FolC bifunctional protein [Nemania serpens]